MSKVKVLIWSVNPREKPWDTLPLTARLEKIARLIENQFGSADYLKQYEDNNHQLSGIFILPEYAFSRPSNSDTHQVDKTGKEEITEFFLQMSKIPGLLIIPGTIPYANDLDTTKRNKFETQWKAFKETGVQDYDGTHIKQTLIGEAEFSFDKLKTENFSHYAKNSAYCFFHNDCDVERHKINKREIITDDYYDTVAFIPGLSDPTFECLGSTVGVSICRDALVGYLNEYKNKVDIEIILSDFIPMLTIQRQATYPHLIIHAATHPGHSGILNSDKTRMEPEHKEIYEGHELGIYTVSLPSLEKTHEHKNAFEP